MKSRVILFLLVILFHYSDLHAQTDLVHFNLDSFFLPAIDRRIMTVNGSMGYGRQDITAGVNSAEDHPSSFGLDLNGQYSRYINSPQRQAYFQVSASPDFRYNKYSESYFYSYSKRSQFSPSLSSYTYNRHYTGKRFFETGYSAHLNFYSSTQTYEDTLGVEKRKPRDFLFDISLPLAIGHGRLEPVSDVSMSLFMLQDALDLGLSPVAFTQEDIYDFASLMATLRNERMFDSRVKRVHDFRSLYDFMLAHDWVIRDDPGFFTVLVDNFLYNLPNYRYSGKQWRYSFTPAYQYENDQTDFIFQSQERAKEITNLVSGALAVGFDKSRQIDLHQQARRAHTLFTKASHLTRSGDFQDETVTWMEAGLTNTFTKDWFPNSRTVVGFYTSVDYTYMRDLSEEDFPSGDDKPDNHLVSLSIGSSADYFLSYRSRLTANLALNYEHNTNEAFPVFTFNPLFSNQRVSGFNLDFQLGLFVNIF
jgi:hypothetical protein